MFARNSLFALLLTSSLAFAGDAVPTDTKLGPIVAVKRSIPLDPAACDEKTYNILDPYHAVCEVRPPSSAAYTSVLAEQPEQLPVFRTAHVGGELEIGFAVHSGGYQIHFTLSHLAREDDLLFKNVKGPLARAYKNLGRKEVSVTLQVVE